MHPMTLQDEIYIQSDVATQANPNGMLVFFITGNPGLIEYYRDFLSRLHNQLREQHPSTDVHVYGASLPGFEVESHSLQSKSARVSDKPLSLKEEIAAAKSRLSAMATSIMSQGNGPLHVVLIGHSVGAYIMLELYSSSLALQETPPGLKRTALIGLFPTIVNIAQSPSGRKAGSILQLPRLSSVISWIAWALFGWMPLVSLTAILRLLLRMPPAVARTTAAFLQSQQGVRQALYMAADEMRDITKDKWSDLYWGVEESPADDKAAKQDDDCNRARMYFYWGVNDHWVDDRSRDEIIKKRGRQGNGDEARPLMEIDPKGIPHAFCFHHSEDIADKVTEYIHDAMKTQ